MRLALVFMCLDAVSSTEQAVFVTNFLSIYAVVQQGHPDSAWPALYRKAANVGGRIGRPSTLFALPSCLREQ
jgi:hypothetical protein